MNLKRQHAYVLALTGYFGLFAVLMAWITWLSPPERFPIALILLIVVGPLLLPMRGLLHGRVYTFQWSTFLALFYCMLASSEVWVNTEDRLLAAGMLIFSLLFLAGTTLYPRLWQKEQDQESGDA